MRELEAFATFLVVILVIALVVGILLLIGWVVTSYQVMRLLQEVGYRHSALAWIPLSGTSYNMLGQCELFCSGKVLESKILWAVWIVAGALNLASGGRAIAASSEHEVLLLAAAIVSAIAALLYVALWIVALISVILLCDRVYISKLGPVLCFILVPFFGTAICVSMIRRGIRSGAGGGL